MQYVYFGHHKCASTWIHEILAEVCREAGLRHALALDPLTPHAAGPLATSVGGPVPRAELGTFLRASGVDFASCITADRAQLEAVAAAGAFRAFHVIRDPRDVIVSAYFSHLHSHPVEGLPHLAAHRERLQAASLEEGLLLEMAFSAQEIHDLAAWPYGRDDVFEVKMEALTARPYETFLEIFAFLGLLDEGETFKIERRARVFARAAVNRLAVRHPALEPLRRPTPVTGGMLLGRVYDHRFVKKAGGRASGRENVRSHYRKGVAGDWANHFTPAHAAAFEARHPGLVDRLGYGPDAQWDALCAEGEGRR